MGAVVAAASMSLDGYIAKADNTIGRLFDWYDAGDVEVPTATPGITFHLTPASAAILAGVDRGARRDRLRPNVVRRH